MQGLDGTAHVDRKAMFMSIMTPSSVARLGQLFADQWRSRLAGWGGSGPVVLRDEVGPLLLRAVCAWAGVPLPESEVVRRNAQMQAMIDGPAALGPRHWRGLRGRLRAERWIADVVERVRIGTLPAPPGSALAIIAEHRDADGQLLPAGSPRWN